VYNPAGLFYRTKDVDLIDYNTDSINYVLKTTKYVKQEGEMFCPKCGKEQPDNPTFCRNCGWRLVDEGTRVAGVTPPSVPANQSVQPQAKVRVNRVGRVLSGLFALFSIWESINGFTYYAESGQANELVVDIILLIVGMGCLLIAFAPEWISSKLRIRLEKGGIFAVVFILLIIVNLVAVALAPEWNY